MARIFTGSSLSIDFMEARVQPARQLVSGRKLRLRSRFEIIACGNDRPDWLYQCYEVLTDALGICYAAGGTLNSRLQINVMIPC